MSQLQSRLINPSFPAELLLEVIQHVKFERPSIPKLRSIHPRFRALINNHERSIIKNYTRRQLPHALADFPCEDSELSYSWLAQCIQQYDIVDEVMSILTSDFNCYAVERHNMPLTNAGLLLLYRLHSIQPYTEQIAFLKSLPRDPLTAMFLAIHYSTLTARYHGDGIINQRTYGRFLDANQLELRNDVEFCFAEGALNLGPKYIFDTLQNVEGAETTLLLFYHEHTIHDWEVDDTQHENFSPPVTEGPFQEPGSRPRSLFTTLLERMAELIDTPLPEIVGRIMEDVEAADHRLSWLSLAGKARLISGKDLVDC